MNHNRQLEDLNHLISKQPRTMKQQKNQEVMHHILVKKDNNNKKLLHKMHSTLASIKRHKTKLLLSINLQNNKLIHLTSVNKNKHFKLLLQNRTLILLTFLTLEMIIKLLPKTISNKMHSLTQQMLSTTATNRT